MAPCPSCKNTDDDKFELRKVENGNDIVCKVCRATVFGVRKPGPEDMEWAKNEVKEILKERNE